MAILMADWERKAIRARVRAGIDEPRRRGQHLGRPRRVVDFERAWQLMAAGRDLRATARALGVAQRTLGRALGVAQEPSPEATVQGRGTTLGGS
jgi:DNA invertase Pin-like site-specific DNA recombinase